MESKFFFSMGGIVMECGKPVATPPNVAERVAGIREAYTVRPLANDAEFAAWRASNPGVKSWKTVDGIRVAE